MTYLIARAAADLSRTFAEIAGMTEYQLFSVLFHDRDDKGNLRLPDRPPSDAGVDLRQLCLSRGVPRHRLDEEVKKLRG